MSLATVLFLIFLVLKLTGFIAWSWWAVVSPLLVVAGFAVTGTLLAAAITAFVSSKQ